MVVQQHSKNQDITGAMQAPATVRQVRHSIFRGKKRTRESVSVRKAGHPEEGMRHLCFLNVRIALRPYGWKKYIPEV